MLPEKIDPEKQYAIRISRVVTIDAETRLLPSHAEIYVSGVILEQIKDAVIEAHECK